MTLLKNRVIGMALLTIGLGVSALQADSVQGRFTLPFDAQWGNVALKAGDYTLSGAAFTSWPKIIALSGNEKTVYILAGGEAIAPLSDRSYLKIVNVNGSHFVTEYRSGLAGKSFTFQPPKSIRALMAAEKKAGTEIAVMIRH